MSACSVLLILVVLAAEHARDDGWPTWLQTGLAYLSAVLLVFVIVYALYWAVLHVRKWRAPK